MSEAKKKEYFCKKRLNTKRLPDPNPQKMLEKPSKSLAVGIERKAGLLDEMLVILTTSSQQETGPARSKLCLAQRLAPHFSGG